MRIHAVGGDVADVAPSLAEAAVLWLRSGFNGRRGTWFKLLERYLIRLKPVLSLPMNPRAKPCSGSDIDLGRPWETSADQVLRIRPKDGRLRYLYILANPTNIVGHETADRISARLWRSLRILAEHRVRSVAMIHIPLAVPRGERRQPYDNASAQAMIEALTTWDQHNPCRIDDVYLVDRRNSFRSLVEQANRASEADRTPKKRRKRITTH